MRGPLFQHAYLVPDLDAAIYRWAETIGAGPFFVTRHHVADSFMYRGTENEADVSYAFGYADHTQIQLIEQHDDQASIYRDMFDVRGPGGLHHVARLVPDYQGERERLLDLGFELACELHATDVDAAYFDTREAIGCFTELHSESERIFATFGRWHEAHLNWDGDDPLRVHISGT